MRSPALSSTRDPLTGALNRKAFLDRLGAEVAYGARHNAPLSLLLLDVDRFKSINDTHGHTAGDAVLRALAKYLSGALRIEDGLCRYGGEEFAIFARGVGLPDAVKLAERLRTGIHESRVIGGRQKIRFTVSIGVAELKELRKPGAEGLIELADQRLYAAKEGGRNMVVSTT
jgi:diguanylate cyclase (GGDEF)-like protein